MTRRLFAAVVAALLLGRTTLAQGPEDIPTRPTALPGPAAPAPTAAVPAADVAVTPVVLNDACCEDAGGAHWWFTADHLFAWVRGMPLPPLVTTSPPGTPAALAGVLGQPGTAILFGDERVNEDVRNGLRLGAGVQFGPADELGIETGFLVLESQATGFSATSDGSTILARPFLDATTGLPRSILVAFPGALPVSGTGAIDVVARSDNLFGAHVDLTERFYDHGGLRLTSLVGYRFLRYDEGVDIRQDTFPTAPGFVPGTQIHVEDAFISHNEFHGADVGLRTELIGPRWSLELLTKVAVGNVRRENSVRGFRTTTVPGLPPNTVPGGLLALSSNLGTRTSDDWIAVPELGVNLGWRLSEAVRLRVGYTILYWEETARAGSQIDLNVNPNLIPPVVAGGPQQPAPLDRRSDLWVQMLNLGVEFRY